MINHNGEHKEKNEYIYIYIYSFTHVLAEKKFFYHSCHLEAKPTGECLEGELLLRTAFGGKASCWGVDHRWGVGWSHDFKTA